jgi:hypothetical protein
MSYSTAPAFLGDFEYRSHRFVAIDIGVENAFPTYTSYGGEGYFATSRQIATFLPFGLRGVFPILDGRLEPFMGFGGAYVWHSDNNDPSNCCVPPLNSWLWQANIGFRYALDRKHRLWLGTTARYYRDGAGNSKQQYVSWTGDLGYRFGFRK